MNLSDWIERWAGFAAGKTAIRYERSEITYAGLARRIGRIASTLSSEFGVQRGDRVAWLGLNNAECLALFFACARIGAMYMPLNWRLAPAEHLVLIANAEPSLLLAEPEFAAQMETRSLPGNGVQRACTGGARSGWLDWDAAVNAAGFMPGGSGTYDDPVLLCYTSGTTGQPRGAVHTQESVLWNAINSTHMHDLTSQDRVLTTLPMFHVGGLNIQTLPTLHAGATVTLHRKFEPAAALAALESERITLAVFVPTQLDLLMAEPRWASADLSALRCISTGSTIVSPNLIRKVQARGIPVIQVYGSTETGPVVVFQRCADAERAGVAGRCGVHAEMRIVDETGADVPPGQSGEILIRARNVMSGYWRDAAATASTLRDGWFYSGDIGHIDADGYLVVDDRKKDLIISGGENIFPAALEAILAECPEIEEAAVVGRADERWGEVPIAVVVRKPGAQLTAEGVLALFQDRVARYKHPRAVVFVDQLPRSGVGKLAKSDIRKLVLNRQEPHSKVAEHSA
jgi:fatty-acyl-CoA synthase